MSKEEYRKLKDYSHLTNYGEIARLIKKFPELDDSLCWNDYDNTGLDVSFNLYYNNKLVGHFIVGNKDTLFISIATKSNTKDGHTACNNAYKNMTYGTDNDPGLCDRNVDRNSNTYLKETKRYKPSKGILVECNTKFIDYFKTMLKSR